MPNVKLLNGETDSFLIWNVSIGRVGVVLVKKLIKDHLEIFKNAPRAKIKKSEYGPGRTRNSILTGGQIEVSLMGWPY